jgi:putative membrane protein (TIGR04086 family)
VSRVDVKAVLLGAGVALLLIVPVVVAARLLVGDEDVDPTWQIVFAGYVLASTVVGSAVAGRHQPEAPMLHGGLAGVVTFVVAQAISSLARSDAPNPLAFVFFTIVFMSLGVIGGLVSGYVRPRSNERLGGSMEEGGS